MKSTGSEHMTSGSYLLVLGLIWTKFQPTFNIYTIDYIPVDRWGTRFIRIFEASLPQPVHKNCYLTVYGSNEHMFCVQPVDYYIGRI